MEFIKLEEKVFQLGSWVSIDQLEDSLTLTELHRLFVARQEQEYNDRAFRASLEGVSLDPWEDPDAPKTSTFEEIKARAERRAAIANGEANEGDPAPGQFEGFGFISDDEDGE